MTKFIIIEQDGDPAKDLIYPVNTPKEVNAAQQALREAGHTSALVWQTPATVKQLLDGIDNDSRAAFGLLFP